MGRLFRSQYMRPLMTIALSLISGAIPLGWSLVLYLLLIYLVSLVCRDLLGYQDVQHVRVHFESMPRSMLTIVRCSFGDCSSRNGLPIFEHVASAYGDIWLLAYCIFMFFITIGFFNVVTAIFLETTQATARDLNSQKQRERLADKRLWATYATTVVRKLLEHTDVEIPKDTKLSDST